ncbi:MAG: hypothetical protein NZP72_08450 [Geminicoccaceae bacterium]|nr:hypothetical protein [Geminicoccaceae bacterium]
MSAPFAPASAPSPRGGPRTPEGKAKSAANALRHGLRARNFFLLPHEDAQEFAALVEALRRAHAPQDAVELLYVDAIAVAIWREMRADRLEAEAMADVPPPEPERGFGSDLATPAARASLATIVRYRTAAQAEHRRALALLRAYRALRAQRADGAARTAPAEDAQGRKDAETARIGSPPAEDDPPAAPEPARASPRARDRDALALRARIRAFVEQRLAEEARTERTPAADARISEASAAGGPSPPAARRAA